MHWHTDAISSELTFRMVLQTKAEGGGFSGSDPQARFGSSVKAAGLKGSGIGSREHMLVSVKGLLLQASSACLCDIYVFNAPQYPYSSSRPFRR